MSKAAKSIILAAPTPRVITAEQVKSWFKKAKPEWPEPLSPEIDALTALLNSRIFQDVDYWQQREAHERALAATNKAEGSRMLEAVNVLLGEASDLATMTHWIDIEINKNLNFQLSEMWPHLMHIRDYAEKRLKTREPWHFWAWMVFEKVAYAWDEAGHRGHIGREPGSPAFKVVRSAFLALGRRIAPNTLRDALRGHVFHFKVDGHSQERWLDGEFAILDGKRIYWEDAVRLEKAGKLKFFAEDAEVDTPDVIYLAPPKSKTTMENTAKKKRGRPPGKTKAV